jgi:hypothetical protein
MRSSIRTPRGHLGVHEVLTPGAAVQPIASSASVDSAPRSGEDVSFVQEDLDQRVNGIVSTTNIVVEPRSQ